MSNRTRNILRNSTRRQRDSRARQALCQQIWHWLFAHNGADITLDRLLLNPADLAQLPRLPRSLYGRVIADRHVPRGRAIIQRANDGTRVAGPALPNLLTQAEWRLSWYRRVVQWVKDRMQGAALAAKAPPATPRKR